MINQINIKKLLYYFASFDLSIILNQKYKIFKLIIIRIY